MYHLQASWRGRRVFAYIWWLPFPFKWPVLEPSNLLRTERRPIAAYHVFDEAQIGRREGGTGEPATRRNSGYCRSDHYQDGALFPGRTSIYTGRALFFLSMEFILLTFILPRFSPFPSWVISEDGFCRHATRGFSFSSEKQSSITLRQQKTPERFLTCLYSAWQTLLRPILERHSRTLRRRLTIIFMVSDLEAINF